MQGFTENPLPIGSPSASLIHRPEHDMKKSFLSLAILAFAALSAPTQAQTVLTVSSWLPPTHTASMAQKEWCDL